MVELVRALEQLGEDDRDRAILRIMNEVLMPEWESALASPSHDSSSSSRIRAVQRVQNALAATSASFAHHARPLDNARLVQHERNLVAALCERALLCCRDLARESDVHDVPAAPVATTLAPPVRRRA